MYVLWNSFWTTESITDKKKKKLPEHAALKSVEKLCEI